VLHLPQIATDCSLAGVVRAHVAAKDSGIRFIVGTRLVLDDGASYLAWPTDRASYGRLTRFLSLGRIRAKGRVPAHPRRNARPCGRLGHGGHPTFLPDVPFATRLIVDARDLRGRIAMPLLCSAPVIYDGADRHRLEVLSAMTADAGACLLATTDPRYHQPDRRLADVLTAIRLGVPVDRIGFAADRNGERCLKSADEMGRLFASYPDAMANTIRVLDACSGFSLDQLRHEYPDERSSADAQARASASGL
jgi:error-prone DNA polymerase